MLSHALIRRGGVTARRGFALMFALVAAGCGHDAPAPSDTGALDWRAADVCAGVKAKDLADLADGPLHEEREKSADRSGCSFLDRNGAERFTAALAYIGYDPRDLQLLAPDQQLPLATWERQIDLGQDPALVISEAEGACHVLLPLQGDQEGWAVRLDLTPPAGGGRGCDTHLALLQALARRLPDILLSSTNASPAAQNASPELLDSSCAEFRSGKEQANALALPLLDAASKPPSPEAAKAVEVSAPAAAEGYLRSLGVARRLAARPLPSPLRTALRLYAKNAERLRAKLQGPVLPGQSYLIAVMAVHVNEAKALAGCPAAS